MQNPHSCPIIKCKYQEVHFEIIGTEPLAIPLAPQIPAREGLLSYETINFLCNLVQAKLVNAKIETIDLVSAAQLDILPPLPDCDLIFEGKRYGTIRSAKAQHLELLEYYLSETSILKLPQVKSQTLTNQTAINDLFTLTAWQEITLIDRSSYLSCDLSSANYACNLYCSTDLVQKICKITKVTDFVPSHTPQMDQIINYLNQLLGSSFSRVNPWKTRFNRLSTYLKLMVQFDDLTAFILVDNWSQVLAQLNSIPATEAASYNSLIDLAIPFPLVHGQSRLSITEINQLELGDVILFDNVFAPDYVLLDFNKLGYRFKRNQNQLVFCGVEPLN